MSKGKDQHTYDAIVVGSGISGGWAAKEFCERGLKTLLLERGNDMVHPNYPNALSAPWELDFNNELTVKELEEYPIQKHAWEFGRDNHKLYIKDSQWPYTQKNPFSWFRGNQVGGKSLLWNRACYRYSELDFEANLLDGHGNDWPIRYNDIKPWYDYVEKFVGLSGENCELPSLPDQILMPPFEMNYVEKEIKKRIETQYKDIKYIQARAAVLTRPHLGRGSCQARNQCRRGCPYGGYYSSNAGAIPAALATGNLTIRPHSAVESILFDSNKRKAYGVRIVDTQTKLSTEFFGELISLNASAIASTAILLNSKSRDFTEGLGNNNGILGHYLHDHSDSTGAFGIAEFAKDHYSFGQKPNPMYIPRFRNVGNDKQDYLRGYAYECFSSRKTWTKGFEEDGIGLEFKKNLGEAGPWEVGFWAICESLPNKGNKMTLSKTEKDPLGIPKIEIDVKFDENTAKMRIDASEKAKELLENAGIVHVGTYNANPIPGRTIHEYGSARMGNDPKESILNKWNQVHECKNVIVTDGACLPSSPCQNPSLTYMALTARAVNYLVDYYKK
jgi:choline dehydrogenase-like flavoprotein